MHTNLPHLHIVYKSVDLCMHKYKDAVVLDVMSVNKTTQTCHRKQLLLFSLCCH